MFRSKRRFYRPPVRRRNIAWRRPGARPGHSHQGYDSPDIDRRSIKRIVLAVFFGAACCWFFYFFFLSDNWAIKEIKLTGLSSIPETEFLGLVRSETGRKRLFLIPNNNLLLFSKSALKSRLQKKYIVEEIIIDKEFPFALNIEIKEKQARLVLKAVSKMEIKNIASDSETASTTPDNLATTTPETITTSIVTSTDYFYLDVNGIVVGAYAPPSSSQADEAVLPMVEIEYSSQTLVKPGDVVLGSEEIGYIFAIYDALARSSAGVKLESVIYNPQISDELKFLTTEGWQGLLSKKLTLETQMRKLEQVLSEKIKDKRRGLKYVDLRVKDRVYFK